MKENSIDAVLNLQIKNNKKMAELDATKHRILGEHIAIVIKAHGDVSIASLTESINQSISESKSITGDLAHELDLTRLALEATLEHLSSLQQTYALQPTQPAN